MTSMSVPAQLLRITPPPPPCNPVGCSVGLGVGLGMVRGVGVIVLTPNLFNDNYDDDDAFVSPLPPSPPSSSRRCIGSGVGC